MLVSLLYISLPICWEVRFTLMLKSVPAASNYYMRSHCGSHAFVSLVFLFGSLVFVFACHSPHKTPYHPPIQTLRLWRALERVSEQTPQGSPWLLATVDKSGRRRRGVEIISEIKRSIASSVNLPLQTPINPQSFFPPSLSLLPSHSLSIPTAKKREQRQKAVLGEIRRKSAVTLKAIQGITGLRNEPYTAQNPITGCNSICGAEHLVSIYCFYRQIENNLRHTVWLRLSYTNPTCGELKIA